MKVWDHVIELKPGSKHANCKVDPLSPNEQLELPSCKRILEYLVGVYLALQIFNGISGVLHQKKDELLQLVQDY